MKAALVLVSTLVILGYLSAATGSAIWTPTSSIVLPVYTFTSDNFYTVTFGPNPEIATYADINLGNGTALVNVPVGVIFTKSAPGGTSSFYIYQYKNTGGTVNNPSVNFTPYDATKDLTIMIRQDNTNVYVNVSQPGGTWAVASVPVNLSFYNYALNTLRLVGHDPTWIWPIKYVGVTWGILPPTGTTYIPISSFAAGSSLQIVFGPNSGSQPNAEFALGNSNTNVNVPIGVRFTKTSQTYYVYSYWSNGAATVSPSFPYAYDNTKTLTFSMSRDANYIYCNMSQNGGTFLNVWFPPNLINNSVVPTINMLKLVGGSMPWPIYSISVN